jgi:hypothetical protein
VRRKFLRAALAEFASIDDAAAIDFAVLGRGGRPTMNTSVDGRVQVVRLLRHANVHLSATRLSHARRGAVWEGPLGPQEFRYLLIVGMQLPDAIASTRNAKLYDASDLAAMTEWLVTEQQEWGLNHVILRSAEVFASKLLTAAV